MEHLSQRARSTLCEFKGIARYYNATVGDKTVPSAAWSYPNPKPGYEAVRNYLAFYASLMDICSVDGERVRPQEGNSYGGWISSDVIGPFTGAP